MLKMLENFSRARFSARPECVLQLPCGFRRSNSADGMPIARSSGDDGLFWPVFEFSRIFFVICLSFAHEGRSIFVRLSNP